MGKDSIENISSKKCKKRKLNTNFKYNFASKPKINGKWIEKFRLLCRFQAVLNDIGIEGKF
jgi:hypothetical protein